MKSPFPGMDPYLEPHWLDVHTALIAEARRALNHSLPPGLVARAEERIAIDTEDKPIRRVGPDVPVFSPSTADPSEGVGGTLIEAPFKLIVEQDPIVERDVRIIDDSGQLIAVLEFLSPRNKRRPALDEYLEKRASLLRAGVHWAEIDLVRAGNWRALMQPAVCPHDGESLYHVVVYTGATHRVGYLFPITLRGPLPEIPIPLRPKESPVYLKLQTLHDAVYEDGRYDQTVDYSQPLDPPLEDIDRNWAQEILTRAGVV
jgi:hypothetical protein